MNVALIAPTKFLDQLCDARPVQMALAHMILEDVQYRRFYTDRSDLVIMDNSLIELGDAVDFELLVNAASLINPKEVILPDAFRDGQKTISRFLDVITYSDQFTWATNFVVAHGRHNAEWVECFDFFNQHPHAHTIGIPKVLDEIWEPGGRIGACAFLESSGRIREDKNYHLLGVWTDPIEILCLSKFEWIRSVDTALPIHAGMSGCHFGPTGLNGVDKPRRPHRYFPIKDLFYPDIVQHNIEILDGWAQGEQW